MLYEFFKKMSNTESVFPGFKGPLNMMTYTIKFVIQINNTAGNRKKRKVLRACVIKFEYVEYFNKIVEYVEYFNKIVETETVSTIHVE